MSKMPAKKKSCFQITSVTTAQAASSITEDTESLDDPDESRTEDVSSEIFDVSRATDYGGPEGTVERSSSEETLNNVGEAETPGTMSPNLPQDTAAAAMLGARGSAAGIPSCQSPAPHVLPGATTASPSGTQGPTATCSSRFRVIKLDHGSGEPYRRGRWTCTDYYDRDSESALIGRPGDTIRHSTTYEHCADRDSGLGATGGSVLALHMGHGPDSVSDSSLSVVSQLLHHDKPGQASQPAYPGTAGTSPQVLVQQGLGHSGQNGKGSVANQNVSMGLSKGQQPASVSVSQGQTFAYPPGQAQRGHMMSGQSSSQMDYVQQITVMQSQGTTQKATVTTSAGATSSLPGQHLQAGGVQIMGLLSMQPSDSLNQVSGLLHGGPVLQSHQALMQQPGGAVQPNVASIGGVQVTGVGHVSGIPGGHSVLPPGMQNVPVAAPGAGVSGVPSSVPSASVMPVAPSTFVQSPISSHTSVRSNSLGPAVGQLTIQGTAGVHGNLPPSTVSQFQSQPLTGQADDRRKSEPLPQPPISLISEKSFVKVPIMDSLTNPLHLPVFGLPIPVDGDDDSSSSANVVAIDNKIEQAMDLVKSHLMYAVREEVEVLKEQIKELIEKNSTLERENALLKSLSNNDQLSQLSTQVGVGTCQQPPVTSAPLAATQSTLPTQQPNVSSA